MDPTYIANYLHLKETFMNESMIKHRYPMPREVISRNGRHQPSQTSNTW